MTRAWTQSPAMVLLQQCLGPDVTTRSRVVGVSLCVVVYALCCLAAWQASLAGIFQPWALPYLLLTLPANLLALALVRSGWSRHRADPALMIPQNALALGAITLAYVAVGPEDRGLVLVLLTLVMVFGMYTHTPKQTLLIGGGAVLLLASLMVWLVQHDPVYYPLHRELVRFELLAGCLPALIFTAHQLVSWRDKLRIQRSELAAALEIVQQLATTDTLTGLINRRHAQNKLEECLMRHQRYGEPFTLGLIDLDHFKAINDAHGHRVGDEVLVSFARAASAHVRPADTVARWGGEEFLVLFPGASVAQAHAVLHQLQGVLASAEMSAQHPPLRVAFSAGLAQHGEGAALDQTLEHADTALYEAKRGGRRQVVMALGSPSSTLARGVAS